MKKNMIKKALMISAAFGAGYFIGFKRTAETAMDIIDQMEYHHGEEIESLKQAHNVILEYTKQQVAFEQKELKKRGEAIISGLSEHLNSERKLHRLL